jgi:hypothetical protein
MPQLPLVIGCVHVMLESLKRLTQEALLKVLIGEGVEY